MNFKISSPLICFFLLLFYSVPYAYPAENNYYRLLLPYILERQFVTNIEALISSDKAKVWIDSAEFVNPLKERVEPSTISKILLKRKKKYQKTWVELKDLKAIGLKVEYNEASLEFIVEVPPRLRKMNTISISRSNYIPQSDQALENNLLSGFINANSNQDFQYGSTSNTSFARGRQAFQTVFDGALNFNSLVLEGNVSYTEKQNIPWRKGDVRLLKDFEDPMLRVSVGDLIYSTSGFQRFRALGGVSVVSNFNLQPYRLTTPVSAHEIFLKRRSSVRVFINGRFIQTLELPAGRHNLKDFPFNVGVNNITLEITDDVGRTEVVQVPYLFSDQLLAPGISQLSYAVGAPLKTDNDTNRVMRLYNNKQITYSVSHKIGLTKSLTMGAFTQGDKFQNIAGLNSTLQTRFGMWSLEPAYSNIHASFNGIGLRANYLYTDYKGPNETPRTLGLGFETKSPHFAPLDAIQQYQYASYDFSFAYSQQIFRLTSINLTSSYQMNRKRNSSLTDGRSYGFGISRNWVQGLDTTLNVIQSKDQTGISKITAFFLLNWSIPEQNQYVNAIGNSEERYSRIQWNKSSSLNSVGGHNLSVGVERSTKLRSTDARVEYAGNRARVSASHDIDMLAINHYKMDHKTNLRLGTALVFAGGKLAIGRPVTDSFVLVNAVKNLRSENVEVNPQDDGYYQASSSFFGPAVLPEVVSYRYSQLHLGVKEIQPGKSLLKENFVIFPSYKSGTLITVGSENSIFIKGRLMNHAGVPIGLKAGEIHSLDDSKWAPIVIFSNREGNFSIEGLKSGKYELELFDQNQTKTEFFIPEVENGFYDLGTLKLNSI